MPTQETNAVSPPSARRVLAASRRADRLAIVEAGLTPRMAVDLIETADLTALGATIEQQQHDAVIIQMDECSSDTAELVEGLIARRAIPIIVFVDRCDNHCGKTALRAGASAFVVDGLEAHRVDPILELAVERFRLTSALQAELQRSKDDLAARKSIERAKGLLMERRGLNERDAYDSMRRMAMAQGKTVREIAETILSISDLLP